MEISESPPPSSSPDLHIGALVSVTSKSDIHFHGVLHSLNWQESTLALREVRSGDEEYDSMLFSLSDIKDVQVKTAPPAQNAPGTQIDSPTQTHPPTQTNLPTQTEKRHKKHGCWGCFGKTKRSMENGNNNHDPRDPKHFNKKMVWGNHGKENRSDESKKDKTLLQKLQNKKANFLTSISIYCAAQVSIFIFTLSSTSRIRCRLGWASPTFTLVLSLYTLGLVLYHAWAIQMGKEKLEKVEGVILRVARMGYHHLKCILPALVFFGALMVVNVIVAFYSCRA